MPDATYVGAGMPCGNCGNPLTLGQPFHVANCPAATPDPRDPDGPHWTAYKTGRRDEAVYQQRQRIAAPVTAASPDERLREADVIEAVAWSLFPDHPKPMSEAGLDCARRAVDAALAAADREAPDEETR